MMDSGNGDNENSSTEENKESESSLADLADKVKNRRSQSRSRSTKPISTDSQKDASNVNEADWSILEGFEPERPFAEWGGNPKTEALIELVGDASNILLLGPLLCPADYDLCTKLITINHTKPDNLLLVTLTQSPDERLDVLRGYLDELPPNTVILNIGDTARSFSKETIQVTDGNVVIETIADSTDLMRIGIAVSQYLSKWMSNDEHSVMCFHSITALLQFVDDPKVVFRFLHVLQGQVRGMNATAHYHMDEAAHNTELISTYRPVFNEVLTFTDDGTLSIKR